MKNKISTPVTSTPPEFSLDWPAQAIERLDVLAQRHDMSTSEYLLYLVHSQWVIRGCPQAK